MAQDLWGRQEQVLAGGLSADRLFVTWPGMENFGFGLIIQTVGCRYAQPVQRFYELGPGGVPSGGGITVINCDGPNPPSQCADRIQPTYYMVGRAAGQTQFDRVVGPEALTQQFYRTYGSPCGNNVLSISGRVGCGAGGGTGSGISAATRWVMSGLVLGDYQMSVNAQTSYIREGAAGEFCSLYVETQQ